MRVFFLFLRTEYSINSTQDRFYNNITTRCVFYALLLHCVVMDSDIKKYEVAYILSSSLSEAELLDFSEKISALIKEHKGAILHAEHLKKRVLAYMIKKEKNVYLGWITFEMSPETVLTFEKKLKTLTLLRYLVVHKEDKKHAMLKFIPQTSLHAGITKPHAPLEETPETDQKLDLEALDKKLEEILGK